MVQDALGNLFLTTTLGGTMDASNGLRSPRPNDTTTEDGGEFLQVPYTEGLMPGQLIGLGKVLTVYGFDVSFGTDAKGEFLTLSARAHRPAAKSATGAAASDDTPDPTLFYGTTFYGGDNDSGTVYSITGDGSHTVLYQFGRPGQ